MRKIDPKTAVIVAVSIVIAVAIVVLSNACVSRMTGRSSAPDETDLERAAERIMPSWARELRSKAPAEARELQELLMANVWTNRSETAVLEFGPSCFYLDGKAVSYVIEAAETKSSRSEGVQTDTTAFCIRDSSGAYLAYLVRTDGEQPALECEIFEGGPFELSYAASDISLDPELLAWLEGQGVDPSRVVEQVSDWIAANRPSSSKAKWDGVVELDTETSTASFALELDGKGAGTIRVEVDTETSTAEIERG